MAFGGGCGTVVGGVRPVTREKMEEFGCEPIFFAGVMIACERPGKRLCGKGASIP